MNYIYSELSNVATINDLLERVEALEAGKVDKVTGKGLSTNDFETKYKDYLDGIINTEAEE